MKLWTAHVVAALLLVSGYAQAEPSSNVAWNAATLKLVAAGDIERGRTLAAICSACHGADGISLTPVWPSLAGQLPGYTYKQLIDYRDGKRGDPAMAPLVAALSDQDIADLANRGIGFDRFQDRGHEVLGAPGRCSQPVEHGVDLSRVPFGAEFGELGAL